MKRSDVVGYIWVLIAMFLGMSYVATIIDDKRDHWRDVAFNGYADTIFVAEDVIVIRHHVCTTWVARVER